MTVWHRHSQCQWIVRLYKIVLSNYITHRYGHTYGTVSNLNFLEPVILLPTHYQYMTYSDDVIQRLRNFLSVFICTWMQYKRSFYGIIPEIHIRLSSVTWLTYGYCHVHATVYTEGDLFLGTCHNSTLMSLPTYYRYILSYPDSTCLD